MRLILGCVAMLLVVAVAPADDKTEKIDAKKLVCKWEPTGKDKGKGVIEFTKDGKFTFTPPEKKVDVPPATYTWTATRSSSRSNSWGKSSSRR
jgi:uncharacterized protein (TIGR03066 family)